MRSKDIIKILQELDPKGELEVGIGNCDILDIHIAPAYYDGCLQVLKHNQTDAMCEDRCHDIVGGKYTDKGFKIVIEALSLSDAYIQAIVYDTPFDIEYDLEDVRKDHYIIKITKVENEGLELKKLVEKR